MKLIGKNAEKWIFSELSMIFTEKSAYQAENCDLWKITKNVITHDQIVRFGSFLDMLVLTTSRIGFGVKILIFTFFSKKSLIFSQNRLFWMKSAIFHWKMKISKTWHQNLFYQLLGPTYPKMSQIGQSGDELLHFSWFFTNRDFQPAVLIFLWKSSIFRWIFTFLHFCPLFS